jgi:NAD(P)-dependent dehydrogenase (short-subunit alcohol dehydrogenase family)
MRLRGKTALVTGGTSGIGRATAEAFAREGAEVIVSGRDERRGAEVVAAIAKNGESARFVRADLSDLGSVKELAAQALSNGHAGVDILVNNAGSFAFGPTESFPLDDFEAMFATNVRAPFFLTAALAPEMAKRGGGKVINVSTMAAHVGLPGGAAYGASKAALELLTKSWAAEYGPQGVNVNAIAPGPIRTPGTEAMGEGFEQIVATVPAGRAGEAAEIAAAAVFLASSDAGYIHGATLIVDGGRVAS